MTDRTATRYEESMKGLFSTNIETDKPGTVNPQYCDVISICNRPFLRLAGLPGPKADFRVNLSYRLSKIKKASARQIIYEYYGKWLIPSTSTAFAVRTREIQITFSIMESGIKELYDLEKDPYEMN